MSAVKDFERRKGKLSDRLLQQSVFKALYSNHLSKVCEQLNGDSCLNRNWKGLAISLLQPSPIDMATMQRLSKGNEGYETLSTWLKVNEEGSFDELLQAMVECKVYAAAEELLNYLESVNRDDEKITEEYMVGIKEVLEENKCQNDQATTSVNEAPLDKETPKGDDIKRHDIKRHDIKRSISWRDKVKSFWQKRSKSCPADHPSIVDIPQDEPEKKKDGIFIVSLNEDSQAAPMMDLLSFVHNLKRVKEGEWHVDTIHDLPGGPMATHWLQEKVETAVYVLICFSEKMKEVFLHSQQFAGQSECNLKFTLDCLITGKLYLDMCYNHGGKFLPILLPGNKLSCMSIMQCLALFKTYNWPDEEESIKKYLLNLPERTPPPLGQRKQLVSKEL